MSVTAASGAPPQGYTRHAFTFKGTAGEYFRIWIVNVLLSIVTLGIYSAWAKVRRKQYFYSNTEFDGSTFEYTGDPIAILKGRLIAYGVLIAMAVSARFSVGLYLVLILLIAIAMPWLIVKSLAFNARNSRWRGIAFHFRGYLDEAYGVYYGWPILGNLTLGALWPMVIRKQHGFVSSNHRFGSAKFEFSGRDGQYYLHLLAPILIGVIAYFALIFVAFAAGMATRPAAPTGMMATLLLVYPLILMFVVYFRATNLNLLYGNTRLGEHRLASTLPFWPLLWIYVSNLLAVVFSLGLAVPWAEIRLQKFRVANTFVDSQSDFGSFIASNEAMPNAIAEEVAGAMDFGIDISL